MPAPMAEASPRISERIAMVVVPLAPVPWLAKTLKVVAVRLPILAPAAEPREEPRIKDAPPATGLASEAAAKVVAPPAPPLKVITLAPTPTVRVPMVSETALEALPPNTNVPPWIVRFLPCRRFVR